MLSSLTGEKFNHRELFAVKNSSYLDKFWVGVSEQRVSNRRAPALPPRPPFRPLMILTRSAALFLSPYSREPPANLIHLIYNGHQLGQYRPSTFARYLANLWRFKP